MSATEQGPAWQARRDGMTRLVLLRFRQFGPMTVAECAACLGKSVLHVAPRVTELIHLGALEVDLESARRRAPSGRGRPALVYRAAGESNQ